MLGRNLPIVMDFLVVLRHVNAELLGLVLAEEGVTRDQADILAARLARYSIMTTSEDADAESFRLHERSDGTVWPRCHRTRCAADTSGRSTYMRRRSPTSNLSGTPMPTTRSRSGRSLSHRSSGPAAGMALPRGAQPEQAPQPADRRGITQIFLEAFWWWGFYVRSPVCEQLLREFDLISADKSDADRQWLGDLSTLYRNFRWGYVYNVPGPRDWAEVGPAMLGLRRRAGLNQGKTMDKGRYAIDVITDVYRAQAAAFRDPGGDPDAAAGLFANARAAVRRSVAAGNIAHIWWDAWIVYFTADMWSSCGRQDEASAGLRELDVLADAPNAKDLFDRDLISRTASLQGEVYLARGDYAPAIDSCARAALLVYAYHVSQETAEQPPNEYTYARHAECITRAQVCLAEVREHDPAAWRSGILRMCVTFAPYWRLVGGAAVGQFVSPVGSPPADWPPLDGPALPEGIIPPLPDRAYLGNLDSPFTRLAKRLVNELEPALDIWVPFGEPDEAHRTTRRLVSGGNMPSSASRGIVIADARDDNLRLVPELYRSVLALCFPPDELETEEGLIGGLRSGRSRALIARDADGTIAGGAVGDYFPRSDVMLLAYLAVRPGGRGTGIGATLLQAARDAWTAELSPRLIVLEVEDPREVTGSEAFGDPVARVRFYERHGARALPLPYVMPALSPGTERVKRLMLMVLGGTDLAPGTRTADGRRWPASSPSTSRSSKVQPGPATPNSTCC